MKFREYLPFKDITWKEIRITKKKLKRFLGIGITAIIGWLIYTRTGFDKAVENLLMNIPILNQLLQFELFKVFALAIVLYYLKDIID